MAGKKTDNGAGTICYSCADGSTSFGEQFAAYIGVHIFSNLQTGVQHLIFGADVRIGVCPYGSGIV